MPNHVTNKLTFLGSTDSIKRLREKCKGEKTPFSFQSFYPMPQELMGTSSPAKIVTEQELQEWKDKLDSGELSEWEREYRPITQKESNTYRIKYGTDNWYDWHLQNWGTKWDCYNHHETQDCEIEFDTAWSTPIRALIELSKQFDDVTIEVKYADEDFGANVGTYTLQGGVIVEAYQPEYSRESVRLAMDILGDTEYWVTDRLCELEEDKLTDFEGWLVEIAHEEGNLLEEYPIVVLEKLKDMAVREQQYERANKIKRLISVKLNADNM